MRRWGWGANGGVDLFRSDNLPVASYLLWPQAPAPGYHHAEALMTVFFVCFFSPSWRPMAALTLAVAITLPPRGSRAINLPETRTLGNDFSSRGEHVCVVAAGWCAAAARSCLLCQTSYTVTTSVTYYLASRGSIHKDRLLPPMGPGIPFIKYSWVAIIQLNVRIIQLNVRIEC